MTYRKKLIEVALPLEAINVASAHEKMPGIGAHPRGLHLWWARRPLAAARAVIFSSLVDDPDSPDALPAFVQACKNLPWGANSHLNDTPRMRLFDFIERLVTWEATTDEAILNTARELILISTEGNPPPLLDPFAGGGSIPLEAQRLGLEAHASDLNPVAVMINKAQIEIPPRFANRPPVNPRDREKMFGGGSKGMMHHAPTDDTWKGASGLAADVRYYGEWMREKAFERIGHLYPKYHTGRGTMHRAPTNASAPTDAGGETVIAWLWARTVKSPNPAVNIHVPLVRSFELSKKKGKRAWVEPVIQNGQFEFVVRREQDGADPKTIQNGTMLSRQGAICIISGEPISYDYIRTEGKAGRMDVKLLAIVTEGKGGRNYYTPNGWHEQIARDAEQVDSWKPGGEMPLKHRNFQPPVYGMYTFGDLFTPRQLVALTTFSDLVAEAREQAYQDALASGLPDDAIALRDGGNGALAYAEAVSVYLAFAVDRCTDFNNTITRWASSNDKVMNMFARQAIPMTWDFSEANIMQKVVGGWTTCVEYISDCIKTLSSTRLGFVFQQDAQQLNQTNAIALSTDPPYYDNIGYADLSDFFYVWMRKNLRSVYPDIFGTLLVPKEPELVATPHRFGGDRAKANQFFEDGMVEAFSHMRRFTHTDYPLTIYYAFKQQEAGEEVDDDYDDDGTGTMHHAPTKKSAVASTGWETMLNGIIRAGFSINGTYPMRSEQSSRIIGMGTNALASSIVIVCRPRGEHATSINRRQFLDALRRELPLALRDLQTGNIAPVDLAQASIGPGMAIYSRHSQVLEANGSAMSVRTALGLINQELDAYLAEQDGDIDADTRFAVDWFTQFGFKEADFGQADTLARAKNTSVSGVEAANIIRSGRGKVALLSPEDLYEANPDWDPKTDKRSTIWEATHYLIALLHRHGEAGAARLMTKMSPEMLAEARNLAYRLYGICERKGWTDHARDYNALVISWSGIGEVVATLQDGNKTTQMRLIDDV